MCMIVSSHRGKSARYTGDRRRSAVRGDKVVAVHWAGASVRPLVNHARASNKHAGSVAGRCFSSGFAGEPVRRAYNQARYTYNSDNNHAAYKTRSDRAVSYRHGACRCDAALVIRHRPPADFHPTTTINAGSPLSPRRRRAVLMRP